MQSEVAPFDVGTRLRALRKRSGLSQRELAKRARVTNSTISLIEQNRVSPSVGSLKKVLDGIPISLAEFFKDPRDSGERWFYDRSELVELAADGISYRQVGRDLTGRALQILHETYAPGADTGPSMLQHNAEEGGVVVRGRIEITWGEESRVLGPGDAYYFRSSTPHRFRNTGGEECELVSACTPPTF